MEIDEVRETDFLDFSDYCSEFSAALRDMLEQRGQMALTADGWPRPVSALTISDSPRLVIAGEQLGARLTAKIQLSEQNVTPCSKRHN